MVKELTGLGLKEAKDVVDSAPSNVKKVFLKKRLKVLKNL
jgi:large subunit ribosomal protein L7/L12